MKSLLRLSKLILPLFPVMALAVILGSAGFFCAIGIPVAGARALAGSFPCYLLLLMGLARGVLHYGEQYCNHFIAFTLLARIRNRVFAKLRELGPAKLEGREKGNLISLLTSDIELLELFYAHTVSPVCIALIVSAASCIFFWRLHPLLALLALLSYALIGIGLSLAVKAPALKAGEINRGQIAAMNSLLTDSLRGITQSIIYGTGHKKRTQLLEESDRLAESQQTMAISCGITAALVDLLVTVAACSSLALSLLLYQRGALGFTDMLVAVTAMFSSFGPVVAVARLGSSLSDTMAAARRLLSLLDEEAAVKEVTDGRNVDFSGAAFEETGFSYGDGKEVLSGVTLALQQGKITGIGGRSGSGKSTLLKLLMRFWEPDRGKVTISGADLASINTACLRSLESYVTQESQLFHDSIANNLRIARLTASDREVEEACRKAGIHDFICSLPQGYRTPVAELGDNFSGGERQRLALARAFLHDSPLLLLDEPTSNLDSYNEQLVLGSIKEEHRKGGRTVVLVSHRESTLQAADSVFHLETRRKS